MSVAASILLYLAVIGISCFFLRHLVGTSRAGISGECFAGGLGAGNGCKVILTCLVCILPVLLLYSLQVGISYDYDAYEKTYHVLHHAGFLEYWTLHPKGGAHFYVEPGYYLLNRLAPNFHALLFLNALVIFIPIFKAIGIYRNDFSPNFPFFIYYTTQLWGAMNLLRYAMALSFILLALVYLIHDKNLKFLACIMIASLFHTTAWIVLAYFLIKEFRSRLLNYIRDFALLAVTILMPYAGRFFYALTSFIPAFGRLYKVYPLALEPKFSPVWWVNFVPVIFPLLFLLRRNMFESREERTMFRILITEIPLRLLAFYNRWLGRLSRIPQVTQAIFIPYMLKKIKRPEDRRLLLVYYIIWYIFYFLFRFFTYNKTQVYQWIFS